MAKPQTLRTIEDYRPALLWLMGQLKRAQKWDALADFERELGTLIPQEHRQENNRGQIRWRDYYVSRARRALGKAGLIESGHGIWKITSAGQQWLAEHPDGGGEELKTFIRSVKKRKEPGDTGAQRASGQAARSRARGVADLDHPVEFTVADHRFSMSGHQVLEQARQVLADDIPPEAQRYRKWVVDVDGQPVGAKWVFGLAIGLAVDQFSVSRARSILRRMGIEVRSLNRTASPGTSKVTVRPRTARRKKPTDNAERRHRLLDTEIRAVRDFLDGNATSRPTDEYLCYWVYLCLTFELHREGWQLFTLIDPSQVSRTLYERTNRFAQACQIRAEVQT